MNLKDIMLSESSKTKLCTAGFHLYEIPKIYEPTEINQMVHTRGMGKMRWELTV